ncbi:Guanine nucleotide exchange factor for Cdc42p [Coemansia sp. RSA 2711]|nr:Guanine nucleotide exchange factor for Cdc42p [Coemansia sp. RSA 2711]KAJ1845878.1 Guanine nucleotide exchange factor for Cdc42p [Coemansia sp. RSA 2708]KAJ2310494.1 Guanine nucleotide exchange factor for Cdc42p [Coemansia sp. RSA 2705]KAJ2318550.1 Guanine nucleotide exchange factor for Cdc42p [Coemansia sp. RSA 2704]KAJ2326577.1 Guanine nucleotide exchange factor for Cdc42p [Coemansia sp. RSA 2702]KAJ2734781.1 Guanine nucleotide exchange factor for Cdc42p [Coemansia sp. Cherry 401B]
MELTRRAVPNVGMAPMETSIPSQNMDSILNRNTPATSIYQTSLNLLDKLACIEGFEVYLKSLLEDTTRDTKSSTPYLNPIQLLWDTFRQGTSLCVIYNALQPAEPLSTTLDESSNLLRQRKDRVYRFVKACKDNQIVREEDLFTISELFKDDTNSFVKVLKTIEIVVDTVQSRGLLDTSRVVEKPSARFAEAQLGPPQDNRERAVKEFVETERKYVHDLELLQAYMDELTKRNVISSDSIRYMFANLNSIVDFQRRFLIGVEANASQPPEDQHFGAVFVNMKEGFMVYEPYCANYSRATNICQAEKEPLKVLGHIIEPHYELPSMLIKPVQRICKYPMMMEELTKFYEKTSPIYNELREGISVVNGIVEQVNEAERREGNLTVVSELEERVEDWKGYAISTFGELHLHDSFVMSTTGVERVLLIYLFENILICCKEVSEKDKRRPQKHRSNALQLKGRIFLFSIHSVVDTSRESHLSLTIYWRDVVMENFSLACRTEDQLKLWKGTMERLMARTKERAAEQAQASPSSQQLLQAQRSASGQHDSYESEDDASMPRRGRYSEGSSLTAAMQQEKAQGALAYRKTYDGAGRARGGAKKLAGDYQAELVDGIERSATISTFHRRQGTGGSSSSFGDAADQHRSRSSPMSGAPYYSKQDMPPVPPVHRVDDGRPAGKGPGTIPISSPMPTAFTSAISPMTPGTVGAPTTASPLPASSTPVQPGAPPKAVKVKVHFQNDIFVIIIRNSVTFDDLVGRVDRKIKICAGPHVGINSSNEQDIAAAALLNIRMRYQDEDGDMILIGSDEDVQLAFESANAARRDETTMSTLNLFVSI